MAAPAPAARAVGRAIWQAIKEAGKVAMPDDPRDFKETLGNVFELLKVWMHRVGNDRYPTSTPGLEEQEEQAESIRVTKSDNLKLFKAVTAMGMLFVVHKLDMAAQQRIAKAKENGVGLFLAISAAATVPMPIAPAPLLKTRNMVAREVASAASLLAGPICPGLLTRPRNVAMSGSPSSSPRFDPTGFLLAVFLPVLSSLCEE